jgi:MFS family permease
VLFNFQIKHYHSTKTIQANLFVIFICCNLFGEPPITATHRNNWRFTIYLFAATGLVESLAFGHLAAFTPLFLVQLHVTPEWVPTWTGILSALGFIIGLPLLPFWPIWADRYGRKLIIIRSSIAGATLFALAGASANVWMLAGARFLSGFVLGNTGLMMAVQAEITPRDKLGSAISIISAGSPVGMAIGPWLGGLLVQRFGIRDLLYLDAGLTLCIAISLALFLKEDPRDWKIAQNTRSGLADALHTVAAVPSIRALFITTFLLMFGISLAQPFVPILIQTLYSGAHLAIMIGKILTFSGIAMAIATPIWGPVADRFGHLRVWRWCAFFSAISLIEQALVHSILPLGIWRVIQGGFQGGLGALAMTLLALYSPREKRSTALTLSLLPMQFSWFLGPVAGSFLSKGGNTLPFLAGGISLFAGWLLSLRLKPPDMDRERT